MPPAQGEGKLLRESTPIVYPRHKSRHRVLKMHQLLRCVWVRPLRWGLWHSEVLLQLQAWPGGRARIFPRRIMISSSLSFQVRGKKRRNAFLLARLSRDRNAHQEEIASSALRVFNQTTSAAAPNPSPGCPPCSQRGGKQQHPASTGGTGRGQERWTPRTHGCSPVKNRTAES